MLDFAGHFALPDLPGNAYDCTDNIEMKTSLWMLIVDRTGHSPEKVITHGASRTAPER
jgi:hypothetical protein